MPIVYLTTNLINGKKYLGKCAHKKNYYLGSGLALKKAIIKYGKENFKKEILFEVSTLQEAAEIEKKLSIDWNVSSDENWYNLKLGGDGGSIKGIPKTEETKKKISESRKGKTPQVGILNHFYGKKHTQEWRDSHSKKLKGRKGISGENHSSSKKVTFFDVHDNEYHVTGIREFCRLKNISYSSIIWRLRNNKFIPTKCGWKVKYD